jgi:small multidrug resistance pump
MLLGIAVASELAGTIALKLSDGFTRLVPTIAMVGCYAAAFWLMALAVRTLPIGIVYAVWAGLGIAGTAALGHIMFRDQLSLVDYCGIGLVLAGVLVLTLMSGRGAHA